MSQDPRVKRWRYSGADRPPFATPPGLGQESVWDYPRPPRLAPDAREVVVQYGSVELARTRRAIRVLETASPPTFYLPPDDVVVALLTPAPGHSYCEWKGAAQYWTVRAEGVQLVAAGWSYPRPLPEFAAIRGYFGFYPGKLACFVAGARVLPQPGEFYAGWITPELVGPFKGESGTGGW